MAEMGFYKTLLFLFSFEQSKASVEGVEHSWVSSAGVLTGPTVSDGLADCHKEKSSA